MKAVVTVTGTDRRGIIAKVSGFLAARGVNIEDISQTILGDQFAMIMVVDLAESERAIGELADELSGFGKEIGMNIRMQHEDIFNAMHRI